MPALISWLKCSHISIQMHSFAISIVVDTLCMLSWTNTVRLQSAVRQQNLLFGNNLFIGLNFILIFFLFFSFLHENWNNRQRTKINERVQRVRLVNNNNMVTHNKLNIYCYYVLQNNAHNSYVNRQITPHKCMRRSEKDEEEKRQRDSSDCNTKPWTYRERRKKTNTESDTWMPINFQTNRSTKHAYGISIHHIT